MQSNGYTADLSKWISRDAFVLKDESVRNLDPNSPLLTEDEKKRIAQEARVNPLYFSKIVCAIKETA